MYNILLITLVAITVVLLIALIIIRTTTKDRSNSSDTIFTAKKRADINYWYKIYQFANNFLLTRWYCRSVQKQLELFMPGDNKKVTELTGKILAGIGALILVIALALLLIQPSLYIVVCAVVVVVVMSKQSMQMLINTNESKLLNELETFLELVQFHFLQSHMIDEAIRDSLNGKNKTMERHGTFILNVIQSEDCEGELAQYLKSVHNKYLREFMCICITTHLYGDNETDGKSRFLESLKGLKGRIGDAKGEAATVSYNFKMLPILCVLPIFTLDACKNWAIGVIPELEAYYEGYFGMASMVGCFLVSITCYLVINYLKDPKLADLSDHKLLNQIYWWKPVRKIINGYYDRNYGKYLQFSKLLRQTGSRLNANTFMVRRAIFTIITFISVVTMCFTLHAYTRNRIDTQVTGTGSKSSMASEEDSIIMMLMIRGYTEKYLKIDLVQLYNDMVDGTSDVQYEKALIVNESVKAYFKQFLLNDFLNGDGCIISDDLAIDVVHQYNKEHASSTKIYTAYLGTSLEDEIGADALMLQEGYSQMGRLQETAMKSLAFGETSQLYDSVADDIVDRIVTYQNAYFHWYEMALAVGLAIGAFWVPYLWILFTKRDSQQLMEDEVMQFQALILILMPIKEMSTAIIMDWMLKFSSIFRTSIHKCTVHLDSDEEKAFNDLIDAEPYSPFQDIVRKLEMCDKVGVYKAFYNMDVTHHNFCEYRKQSNDRRVQSNSSMASMVVMAPLMMVLAIYLIAPFMIESFGQLSTTMSQLSAL